jgi:hypothetical protein
MEEERSDNENILFSARIEKKDKLHDSYIWHIITLAKMKYKLRQLKGGDKCQENTVKNC